MQKDCNFTSFFDSETLISYSHKLKPHFKSKFISFPSLEVPPSIQCTPKKNKMCSHHPQLPSYLPQGKTLITIKEWFAKYEETVSKAIQAHYNTCNFGRSASSGPLGFSTPCYNHNLYKLTNCHMQVFQIASKWW